MKKKLAFTFIEVIIAITVFAIGVLAVLRLITQNLVTLDETQIRTTATFLAKEWIELVYTIRDANLQKSLPWDCVLDPAFAADDFGLFEPDQACMWYFSSWADREEVLHVSFAPTWYVYVDFVPLWGEFDELRENNMLYYTTWLISNVALQRYSNLPVSWEEPSFFARYISFSPVKEWDDVLPSDKILKVASHVLYRKGASTWEVVLESLVGNY